MCCSELGWTVSGSNRAILDIALQRMRFWKQHDVSLAGSTFVSSHAHMGDAWAKSSLATLHAAGLLDWPVWLSDAPPECTYKTYVHKVLSARTSSVWTSSARNHKIPISYLDLTSVPSADLHLALRMGHSWSTLLGHSDLIRLRCGLLDLGHRDGQRSQAKSLQCIACSKYYTSPTLHLVCNCDYVSGPRQQVSDMGVDCSTLLFLCTVPSDAHFPQVVALATHIAGLERHFWRTS